MQIINARDGLAVELHQRTPARLAGLPGSTPSTGKPVSCGRLKNRTTRRWITTVCPREGHYAFDPKVIATYLPADSTIRRIGELVEYDLASFEGLKREKAKSGHSQLSRRCT